MIARSSFLVSGQSMQPQAQELSRDHQGQVIVIATCQSLTVGNAPQGPRSTTHSRVEPTGPYTPRAVSWCAHVST
jgi:hypothetical protein